MDCRIVITANGKGERMKGLSPLPKHELYFGDKKIIDHLLSVFPGAEVLTGKPSNSRKETLEYIKDYKDCLIIDCDIIIPKLLFDTSKDFLYYFTSNKDKYSSLEIDPAFEVYGANETKSISQDKSSGVYFVKSVARLLERMGENSIAEGMIGATAIPENNFIRVGDPDDYYESLGIKGGSFTCNQITFNEKTVIKHCKTGLSEKSWYGKACCFNVPKVLYADEEILLTERIYPTSKPTAEDFIRLITTMKQTHYVTNGAKFKSYIENLPGYDKPLKLQEHEPTFFHGDLSTTNVLKNSRVWLIDPNHKDVFGSWLTDAGKAVFSFIAYEQNYPEAKKIADHFGKQVWSFAVAEGLRVCKYKSEYISIVNNIAELCKT